MRFALAILCLSLIYAYQPTQAQAQLEVGQNFPNLTFSGTLSAADRAYLGLTRPGPFTLKEVRAPYLLLEFFSDTCEHCLLQAPIVERLFHLIAEQAPGRAGAGNPAGLKMMGLGYYCTAAALEKWRQEQGTPFPLIPDPKGQLAHTLDVYHTPSYVVLDHRGTVVYYSEQEIESPQRFLRKLGTCLDF